MTKTYNKRLFCMWCNKKDHLRKSSKLCAFNKNIINKSTESRVQNDNSSTFNLPSTSYATITTIEKASPTNDQLTTKRNEQHATISIPSLSTDTTPNIEITSIINGIINSIDAQNNQDNFRSDEDNGESNSETVHSIFASENKCCMTTCNLNKQNHFRSEESNDESNSESIPSFGNLKNDTNKVSEVSDQISYYSIHPFL